MILRKKTIHRAILRYKIVNKLLKTRTLQESKTKLLNPLKKSSKKIKKSKKSPKMPKLRAVVIKSNHKTKNLRLLSRKLKNLMFLKMLKNKESKSNLMKLRNKKKWKKKKSKLNLKGPILMNIPHVRRPGKSVMLMNLQGSAKFAFQDMFWIFLIPFQQNIKMLSLKIKLY